MTKRKEKKKRKKRIINIDLAVLPSYNTTPLSACLQALCNKSLIFFKKKHHLSLKVQCSKDFSTTCCIGAYFVSFFCLFPNS